MNDSNHMERAGLLYVVPSSLGRSASIVAAWIATASFASAVGARLGQTDVLTPDGILGPEDLFSLAVRGATQPSTARTVIKGLPQPVGSALAEIRTWDRARRMRKLASRMIHRPYRLVIQLHSRYQDCGLVTARGMGAPFVLRVEALEVREEASWGVRRPLWGSLAERLGEIGIIRKADLVASVSDVVDAQLAEVGIEDKRRVVIPNGVDVEAFSPGVKDLDLLRSHRLEDRFVIGWVGGFRPFHGLHAIPAIAEALRARLPQATLCMVGTGPERDAIEKRCRGLEEAVRFVGPVAYKDVPRWIRSFDACLLLAGSGVFHYSPLKLNEYLACGRPVIAAQAGDVPRIIRHGVNGLLVPVGDSQAVVAEIVRLAQDPGLRQRLAVEGRRAAERFGSWGARAEALLAALDDRNLLYSARQDESATGNAHCG